MSEKTTPASPRFIPPRASTREDFPHSTVATEGLQRLPADFSTRNCRLHLGVEYARKSGMPLHLHILEPSQCAGEERTFPLILFVQGSAWFKQDTAAQLPQLARFARRGYVIASVEYRPSPLAPFPAQVQDTKTALRYMQAHAATYHADPGNVILWGDSSGGHTVVLTALTLDDPAFDDAPPTDAPRAVKVVIDYYGPSDISKMNQEPSTMDHIAPDSPEGMLIGGLNVLEHPDKVAPTVLMNHIAPDRLIPPILIMHGSKDRLVPFGQSVMLFEALKTAGKDAACYQLYGADHGGPPFWAEEVLDIVDAFIKERGG